MTRLPKLMWVPAFVVGGCLASVAEFAMGLLVYSGPGLLRSVTTVLSVEAAAFGIGMWTAPDPGGDLSDSLRRRAVATLLAFVLAMSFAAAWSLAPNLAGSALGQALGLTFLAGLPLCAGGALLGGLAAAEPRRSGSAATQVMTRAAMGAVAGFALTGAGLTRVPMPPSLMFACIALLAAAGLLAISLQDRILKVDVKASRMSPLGEVRVEERSLPASGPAVRALVEGGTVRRWMVVDGDPVTSWDVAAMRALLPDPAESLRVLHVGGGASPLARMGIRDHPLVTFDVVERSDDALALSDWFLDGGSPQGDAADGRVSVSVGNLDDALQGRAPYDLVFVDLGALGVLGGLAYLSARSRAELSGLVGVAGTVVLGPSAPSEGVWPLVEGWAVRSFRRVVAVPLGALLGEGLGEEVVTVARRGERADMAPPAGFLEQERAV